MIRSATLAALLLPPLLLATGQEARAADQVTIYHCTDGQGRLTIRDTPCPKGQQQDTRSMLRPQDPPPKPVRPEPTRSSTPAAQPPTRVVVLQPPRPLYECVTPDGERYTSETNDGRPRYVPLWTFGYPLAYGSAARPRPRPPSGARVDIDTGNVRLSAATRPPRQPFPHDYGYGYGYGGATTFVRDECHALPQSEVCARLVDRRDEIRTRFFNAQQRERDTLRVEERGLNARLANDCGVR